MLLIFFSSSEVGKKSLAGSLDPSKNETLRINPLSANLIKWPNTLKQFVGC